MDYRLTRLVDAITLILILLLAVVLANGVLFFLNPSFLSAPPDASLQAAGRNSNSTNSNSIDVAQLAGLNLFGAVRDEEVSALAVTDAPETQLPLTLLGVFNADDPEFSAAIVAQRGKPSQLIKAQDKVAGTNATLVSVHSDFVMLRRAGVTERLSFPEPDENVAEVVSAAPNEVARLDPDDGFEELDLEGLDPETMEELGRENALLQALDAVAETGELDGAALAGLDHEDREMLAEMIESAMADQSEK